MKRDRPLFTPASECQYPKEDLAGKKYKTISVIRFAGIKNNRSYWECVCDCGIKKLSSTTRVKQGGCKRCSYVKHGQAAVRGGRPASPEYAAWCAMIRRCYVPTDTGYKNYGARGITVCDRWRASFLNFLEDMGKRPEKNLTIDRIDNNEGYSRDNCRWATWIEQAENRRGTVYVEYNGDRLTLRSLSEKYAVPLPLIRARIGRGWTVEKSLKTVRYPTKFQSSTY